MTADEILAEASKLGDQLLPTLTAMLPMLGPELLVLDESLHALLAIRSAENKDREQLVAAERAGEGAALDAIERAEVSKP
jgi:hypothetical protein